MIISIPDTAAVIDVARLAAARHLHLITDGERTVLCSFVPPGWHRCSVAERDTAASQEPTRCAA